MKKFKKIYVEITNICNLNCPFCSKDNNKLKEMTKEEFEYILKKINNYTDYLYLHVKGEPLLHSKLNEIIELCDKYHKKVNITTNGTLLKDNLEIMKKVRQINISLHSLLDKEKLFDILKCGDYLSDNSYDKDNEDGYDSLYDNTEFVKIDANETPDLIARKIVDYISNNLLITLDMIDC